MKRSTARRAGFTLLEIMLVVAIIMLLLGTAIYKMAPTLGFGKTAKAKADIEGLKAALMGYESLNGFTPSNEQGLQALSVKPSGDPKPKQWQQFMESVPLDPWGMPYIYEQPGKHHPNGYDIYTAGPDRKPGTEDDIGNWENQ